MHRYLPFTRRCLCAMPLLRSLGLVRLRLQCNSSVGCAAFAGRQEPPRVSAGFSSDSSAATSLIGGRGQRPEAPRRIVLIRHGESEGNVNEAAYVRTADWRIGLTERGRQQAAEAGGKLREILGDHPTMWYVSPYARTQQTLSELLKQWHSSTAAGTAGLHEAARPEPAGGYLCLGIREEPRIAEQQFGNFQNVEAVLAAKEERKRFGRFWYRFPGGESGLDVYSRTTSFISTMFRDMRAIQHMLSSPERDSRSGVEYNIVIVTHGLTLRLFLMRWLRWTVMAFENSHNPPNAAVIVMERRQDSSGSQWFALNAKSAQLLNIGAPQQLSLLGSQHPMV